MESEHHEHQHNPKKENVIAASVIIGAILVSASIFYNTKLLINSGGLKTTAATTTGTAGNAQAQAQAQAQTTPVKVDARKDAAVLGKSSAKVELVEFSDFQCPFCKQFFNETYKQLKEKYIDTGKVKLVFRHFPLTSIHPYAQKAGEAAECANRQKKFFEYHDVLFQKGQSNGSGLAVEDLKQYAKDHSDLRIALEQWGSVKF